MNLSPPDLIRALSQPLEPISTGQENLLPKLEGIRGVVFDIYGTLVVSGSGDVGAHEGAQQEAALRSILRDLSLEAPAATASLTEKLHDLILAHHARAREAGIDYPEIEIRDLWAELLGVERGPQLETLAVAYECATNPVWPMPGAQDVLEELERRGLVLGIVSNAQFYTPYIFEAFFLQSLDQLGFDPDLTWFSYRHKHAKPSTWLYVQLRDALSAREIDPGSVLYVGNDALKDIHPAAKTGFRTALFAGDQRSLRLREDESGLHPPDAIVTELSQILELLK